MAADGNVWKISELSISSPDDRFSNEGKMLKSMWVLGPSKAVLSKGKVTDSGSKENNKEDNVTKSNDKESSASDNKSTENNDNASDASTDNKESSTNTSSEEFHHAYSILEAFSYLHPVYEAGKNKKRKNKKRKSKFFRGMQELQAKSSAKTNSKEDGTDKSDKEDAANNASKENDTDVEKSNTQDNDNSEKDKDDEVEVGKFEYSENNVYEFNIGIVAEGYTTWKVAIDARADVVAVKNAIRAKKFKTAYQIACENVTSDGLVPLSCITYVRKAPDGKKNIQPAFIGHCRYAIDSGSESEDRRSKDKEGLTLCLAVAPINGRTKNADEDVVIQAVYNVTSIDGLTGGAIGQLLATATSKIRDKALGTYSDNRYRDSEDKDSEDSQSNPLSDWLHKKFRCVGDHTMYDNFLKLREFIKKQVAAGNLELEAFFVGNEESGSKPMNSQVSTFFKSKKFPTFF